VLNPADENSPADTLDNRARRHGAGHAPPVSIVDGGVQRPAEDAH